MDTTHKSFEKNSPEDSKKESCLAGYLGPTSCKLKNARKTKDHVLLIIFDVLIKKQTPAIVLSVV